MIMFCNANRCDIVLLNISVMYYMCNNVKVENKKINLRKDKRLLFVLLILVELVVIAFYTCTFFS